MIRWLNEISIEDDAAPEPHLIAGVQYLGQALVAHLARSRDARSAAFERESFVEALERVEHLSVGATWVMTLARQQSGTIVVLHGETPVGVVVRYENLANCFHLFTLLQAALASSMPGAKRVDSSVIEVATGQTYGDVTDDAWWHFGSGQNALGASVWGEAAVSSLPQHEGQQYLVLWPPLLRNRSWGAGFFGPFLQASPPSVTIERTLPADEVHQWRASVLNV